jgi:hypothetical protein
MHWFKRADARPLRLGDCGDDVSHPLLAVLLGRLRELLAGGKLRVWLRASASHMTTCGPSACPACERERNRRPRRRARGTYEWKQARVAAQDATASAASNAASPTAERSSRSTTKTETRSTNDLSNLETLYVRHHREVGGGTPSRETATRGHPPPGFREKIRLESRRRKRQGTRCFWRERVAVLDAG